MLAPRLAVPDALLTCPAQPEPPADDASDKAVAAWIAAGFDAGQACRDDLAAVKAIVAP